MWGPSCMPTTGQQNGGHRVGCGSRSLHRHLLAIFSTSEQSIHTFLISIQPLEDRRRHLYKRPVDSSVTDFQYCLQQAPSPLLSAFHPSITLRFSIQEWKSWQLSSRNTVVIVVHQDFLDDEREHSTRAEYVIEMRGRAWELLTLPADQAARRIHSSGAPWCLAIQIES